MEHLCESGNWGTFVVKLLRMSSDRTHAPTPPVGVIESISRGFEMVAGHLGLILLPILLDLFLWMGPRVSFQDYFRNTMSPALLQMSSDMGEQGDELAIMVHGDQDDQVQSLFRMPVLDDTFQKILSIGTNVSHSYRCPGR